MKKLISITTVSGVMLSATTFSVIGASSAIPTPQLVQQIWSKSQKTNQDRVNALIGLALFKTLDTIASKACDWKGNSKQSSDNDNTTSDNPFTPPITGKTCYQNIIEVALSNTTPLNTTFYPNFLYKNATKLNISKKVLKGLFSPTATCNESKAGATYFINLNYKPTSNNNTCDVFPNGEKLCAPSEDVKKAYNNFYNNACKKPKKATQGAS